MPPQLGPCISCSSTASKYKCPSCYAPTCSLPCSKSHRASHTSGGSDNHNVASSSTTSPLIQTEQVAHSRHTRKTDQYVPLKDYTENQFLHDYHFLSSIGRKVTSIGAQLSAEGSLPQQIEANDLAVRNQRPSRESGLGGHRPDFEKVKVLKQREGTKNEMKRRRCKVMWLPDGMGRARENSTNWNERVKKMKYSLEVRYPCFRGEEQQSEGSTITFHHLPPTLPIQVKVMNELEKESLKAASKEWKEAHEQEQRSKAIANGSSGVQPQRRHSPKKRGRKGKAEAKDQVDQVISIPAGEDGSSEKVLSEPNHSNLEGTAESNHQKTFYISDFVLHRHGLLDEPVTDDPPQTPSTDPQGYKSLPDTLCLAVKVDNNRLRNESSLKYLDWWDRYGKEQREADEAEEEEERLREERRREEEEQREQRMTNGVSPSGPRAMMGGRQDQSGWGQRSPPSGPAAWRGRNGPPSPIIARSHQVDRTAASLTAPAPQVSPSPFFSPALLASMSAKLGGIRAPAEVAQKEKVEPTYQSQAPQSGEAAPNAESAGPSQTEAAPVQEPPAQPTSSRQRRRRLLYLLPNQLIGIEALLRSFPKDHAVVEYPAIEVWNRKTLMSRTSTGQKDGEEDMIEIVRHVERGEQQIDEEEQSKEQSLPSESGAASPPVPVEPPQALAPAMREVPPQASSSSPIKTPTTTSTPIRSTGLSSLMDYASDSDDEEEQEEAAPLPVVLSPPPAPQQQQRKSASPVELRAIALAKAELLPPLPSSSEISRDNSDGEEEEIVHDSGMASMARHLGWAPPVAPVGVASKKRKEPVAEAESPGKEGHKKRTAIMLEEEQVDWDSM